MSSTVTDHLPSWSSVALTSAWGALTWSKGTTAAAPLLLLPDILLSIFFVQIDMAGLQESLTREQAAARDATASRTALEVALVEQQVCCDWRHNGLHAGTHMYSHKATALYSHDAAHEVSNMEEKRSWTCCMQHRFNICNWAVEAVSGMP